MNKHKVKHHRNSDTKTSNRDHIRTTALELSVKNSFMFEFEQRYEKTNVLVSDLVRHKPGCTATEDI